MSDERNMIAETAERLFAAHLGTATFAAAEAGEWPAALWDEITGNGLDRVLVPEAQGGIGGSWEDAFAILQAAGRHAAPVPLAETIGASWLIARAGLDVPEGVLTLADGDQVAVTEAGGLTGALSRVPWGGAASRVVVQAIGESPDRIAVFSPVGGKGALDHNMGRDPPISLRNRPVARSTGVARPLSRLPQPRFAPGKPPARLPPSPIRCMVPLASPRNITCTT